MTHMKYFIPFLGESASTFVSVGRHSSHHSGSLDISVHCDVKVFDWLASYVAFQACGDIDAVLTPQTGSPDAAEPVLTSKNVVAILVSSDFLKMDALSSICLTFAFKMIPCSWCFSFCHEHINAVLKSSSSLASLPEPLLAKLFLFLCDLAQCSD